MYHSGLKYEKKCNLGKPHFFFEFVSKNWIVIFFIEKLPLRDNAKFRVANLKDKLKSKEDEQNRMKSKCENEEKILKGLHTDIEDIKTKINENQTNIKKLKEEQHTKTSNRQNNVGHTVEVS